MNGWLATPALLLLGLAWPSGFALAEPVKTSTTAVALSAEDRELAEYLTLLESLDLLEDMELLELLPVLEDGDDR